jgi:tetratricopeptide (TPR) repeat protein
LARVPFVLPQLDESTFTGRETEIKQLEEQLFNQSGSHVCSIVGLSGGGGIGKSALACHFATIHKDKFPDGIIGLRVDGKSPDQVARQFVNECLKFSGEKLDLEDEQDAATLMQETFAHRRMLLIFDNAVDASLKQLRPGGNLCSVIITTRNRNLSASLDISVEGTIDLDPLPEEKAYQLLERILGAERVNAELEVAYEIVRLVGCLPLALQITGKRLRNKSQSLADYLASLRQERTRLSRLKVWGDDDLNVTVSLNLSLKDLSQEQRDFFACLSVCGEDGFARRTAMAAGGCQDEWDAQDDLQVLYDLSLLNSAQTGENRFVFHPLVRVFARNLAEENNLLAIAQERHAKFFIQWLQSNELENAEIISEVAESLDDVILAAQWLQNQNQESLTEQDKKERYEFILKLQPLFETNGYYEKAIKLMKTFQSWAKEAEDWNAVVKYQMHEARYLSFAGECEKAKEIIKEAEENLKTLESTGHSKYKERKVKLLNVSGGILQKQGKIEEAIKAFKEVVFIDEEIGNDQSLAILYSRLGKLLQSNNELEKAKKAFERGIEVSEAINDQFQRAMYLEALGLLMDEYPNKKENSIMLRIKAAEIYKNVNREHRAAGIYITIGTFHQSQNLLDESLAMFLLAAELYQNIDLDNLIEGLRNLAEKFHEKRNFRQALDAVNAMRSLCLAANKKKLLTIAYHRLGIIHSSNNQLTRSQQAFEDEIKVALEINDLSQLAIGLRSLGQLLEKQGKLAEAQQVFEQQILISEKINKKSQLSIGLNCLGRLLQKQGKLAEAQQAFERQILISEEIDDHSQLAFGLHSLGRVLKSQKEFEKAEEVLKRSQQIFENEKDLTNLVKVLNTLGGTLEEQQKWHEAEKLLRQAYDLAVKLEDKRGQATIANSLGQVIGKEKFELAQMYFNQSIKLGVELNDQVHLAKVHTAFLQLKKRNQIAIDRKISINMIKIGVVVFVNRNKKDNLHWGKIAPNDKSPHISFNENFVGSKIVSKLTKGTLVLVVFEEKSGKFYAKRIELMG